MRHGTSMWERPATTTEGLRQLTRTIVPFKIYRGLAQVLDYASVVRTEGLSTCFHLHRIARRDNSTKELHTLHLRSLAGPFTVRTGTTDAHQITQAVIRQSYGIRLPDTAGVIIDAGANIGDTTCWYLTRFPAAKVVAIEPEPRNAALLRRNVSFYGNRCTVIEAALWPRQGYLSLREGESELAASVRDVSDPAEATCRGVTVSEIMSELDVNEIDILKCDIEGAEEPLFSINADEWLSRTKHIYCEVHNEGARLAVLEAARRHGFHWSRYRELYILGRDQ